MRKRCTQRFVIIMYNSAFSIKLNSNMLFSASLAVIGGLCALVWSADRFVDGAASIAESFGVSKLMVGLTIVALGTSAPEMIVSGFAAWVGSPALAMGNVIGSNIANIGLVLGITAIVVAIPVHPLSYKEDLPVYLVVLALVTFLMLDNKLEVVDGIVLVAAVCVVMFLLVKFRANVNDPAIIEEYEADGHEMPISRALMWFVIGLVVLLVSSRLLVWGAVEYARWFGVSEAIIGLTIVAVGTSLPELAASLGSALKNHHDLAIGNILGSNVLNLIAVLPFPAIIAPGLLEPEVLQRDFPVMVGMSVLLAVFIYMPWQKALIGRAKGIVLLAIYISYISWLAYTAS